ncbi:hypothetical protein EPA93_09210 [Ktedonosporobacter rubrisoli]|uniref:Bacteriophage Mu GpT domain-containing protein n=1 Tax=Ktedonosporobacter rubrisoli TaxID=2509675 RepID=A0A4P6JLP4_KTERU|nr:Mu-like prophage major head subunit gpT family protein [Ktedonosporobacter rubrisoli]QBD76177.1 hypothetical protein EPA93_09210 [Ktedonosporobacter rubrisoli]
MMKTHKQASQRISEARWTAQARRAYHQAHPENFAGPEASFPIKDAQDVRDAARLHGQAAQPEEVKRKIIAIARRLKLEHALPQAWSTEDGQPPASSVKEAHIQLDEAQIIEQLTAGQEGHALRVTVIQGGTSKNGYHYDEPALAAIAQLIEGAQAYADHASPEAASSVRSVRDVVGFYHDAQLVPASAKQPARVEATLHLFEAADWLWSVVREAMSLGRPELIGLSIDILGQWQHNEASGARDVTQVLALNSCDIVTRPSAGGAFRRILHELSPAPVSAQGDPMDVESIVEEELSSLPSAAAEESPQLAATSPIQEEQRHLQQLLEETRRQRCELLLERRLRESILPSALCAQIRTRFQGRIFEERELDAELNSSLGLMAQLTRDGLIRGQGYEKPTVGQMISEAEKIQASFDRMFDLDIDTARLGNIRPFEGLREAYARVTGDAAISGTMHSSQLGQIRVSEHAPIARISEADTTTASFSYLLGTSMNKRLLKDYQAWPAEWQRFCSIMPIRDFKQQTRVRFGAFGSLPIVAEDSAYTAVTLADSAAVYVPQKRGNLVTVSREVILNDDLQAVKQIPTKLAVAAAYTLAEFVYGFLSGNPTIYDGNPLFTSGAPHSNLGASALSTAAMQSGVTAMREQTNYAGKRIGLRPRYLIVPPELEWTAMVATKSAGVPGSNNNDINPMLGYVTPIVSPQLSSATQWFMAADPREVDTIEVGFVGGQVNPALFVQDMPLFGMNFTQDVIS